MDTIQHNEYPYQFDPSACSDCAGHCCKGKSGNIWVSAIEIEQIADVLGTSQFGAISTYFTLINNRLSVKERYAEGQFECVFFDGQSHKCSIYSARPNQCRSFPFWPYYRNRLNELIDECPGVTPIV